MTKGWYNKSYEHSLASRGIKTIKNKCKINKNKVLYHATIKKINKFSKRDEPTFFSEDENFGKKYLGKNSKTIKVNINVNNTFCLNDKTLEKIINQYFGYFPEQTKRLIDNFNMSESWIRNVILSEIKEMGYDSVIIENDWDGGYGTMKSYIVFDQKNIKII